MYTVLRQRQCASTAVRRAVNHRTLAQPLSTTNKTSKRKPSTGTVSFVDMAYGNPLKLPRLPIPSIKDTMSGYLQVRLRPRQMLILPAAASVRRTLGYSQLHLRPENLKLHFAGRIMCRSSTACCVCAYDERVRWWRKWRFARPSCTCELLSALVLCCGALRSDPSRLLFYC